MTNKALARHLALAADLVELSGGNAFRARAFAQAGRAVERLEVPAEPLVLDGTIIEVPGIGRGLAADLAEFVATGTTRAVTELLEALPPGIPDVLRVKGLGVKKVRQLWTEAGVVSLDTLEAAAVTGRLAELGGFGAKTVQNILAGIELLRSFAGRAHLRDAWREAQTVLKTLTDAGIAAHVAGEVRRQTNVVAQVELVAAGSLLDVSNALARSGLATRPDAGDVGTADQSVAATLPNGQGLTVWITTAERAERALWTHTGPPRAPRRRHRPRRRRRARRGDHRGGDLRRSRPHRHPPRPSRRRLAGRGGARRPARAYRHRATSAARSTTTPRRATARTRSAR